MGKKRTLFFTGVNALESSERPKCLLCGRRQEDSIVVIEKSKGKKGKENTFSVELWGLEVDGREGAITLPVCLSCISVLDFFKHKAIEEFEKRQSKTGKSNKSKTKKHSQSNPIPLTEHSVILKIKKEGLTESFTDSVPSMSKDDKKRPDFMVAYT